MNSSYYAAAESDAQCDFGIYLHTHKAKPKDFLQKEIRFDMITQLRMLKFFVSKKNSETSMNLLPEQIHLSSFLTYILGCRDFEMGACIKKYIF